MFSLSFFKPNLLTLALTSAFAIPAIADELAATSDAAIELQQTYFPKAGTVDIERANSQMIGQIKADYAYMHGITGKGVTIAIMDTGISIVHPEFSEAGKLMQGYNAATGTTNVADKVGHGTHVAGIISADRDGKGMFGVAYDARLLPIKVFSDSGTGSTAYLDQGLRYAIGRASIVNMSLGAASSFDSRALQDAVKGGLLIVAAAGNTGAANPEWPARFAKEAWANNQIIAVGAVDANNRIASFSNRAGDAGAWFLVAPGVDIPSTYQNNQYVYMSGTSMATPMVSGAAALIKQRWSYLRADQIADILFITATDLGAPGIDAIYGRGLLNIEKAMQPVGTVKTTTWNGIAIKVLDTSVKPSSATSNLWNLAASGSLRVVGTDDFNRGFNLDLSNVVVKPTSMSLDQVFGSLDRRVEVAERVLPNGSHLSAAYESNVATIGALSFNQTQRTRLAAFSFVSKHANGMEMALGAGGLAGNYFGAGGLSLGEGLGSVPALANPYFALVPSASHAAVAQNFDGAVKLKFGMLSSGLGQALASQEGIYTPGSIYNPPKVETALMELSKNFGVAAVSLSFSRTNEANAYLGAQSSGVLAFGPKFSTSAVQLAGAWLLGPRLALAGQVAYGITPGSTGNSLIADMTTSRTNAFSVALIASDRITIGDRFSIAISQPMRAYTGTMTLDVISGMDENGAEIRERRDFSMVPAAREVLTEVAYRAPAGKDAFTAFAITLRRNPNNFADMAPEKLLAMRYMKQF